MDEDFQVFLESIQNDNPRERIIICKIIHGKPTGDKRVLSYLEAVLKDDEVGLLMTPYAYGEVRIAAAFALQAERQALGITEPVVLRQVPRPLMSAHGLGAIRILAKREKPEIEHAIKHATERARKLPGDHQVSLAEYKVLREYNQIPLFDLELKTTDGIKYLFVAGTPI